MPNMEAKTKINPETCTNKFLKQVNKKFLKNSWFGTRIEFLLIFQLSDRNSQKIQKVPNKVF